MLAHSFRTVLTYLIATLIVVLILICALWRYRKKAINLLQYNDTQEEAIEKDSEKLTSQRNTLTWV